MRAFADKLAVEGVFAHRDWEGVGEGALDGFAPDAARVVDVLDGEERRLVGGAGILDLLAVGVLQRNAADEEVERADVEQPKFEWLGGQGDRRRHRRVRWGGGGGRVAPAGGESREQGERQRGEREGVAGEHNSVFRRAFREGQAGAPYALPRGPTDAR